MAGKAVKVILPLAGKLCFQPVKLRIGKNDIVVSAIGGGGGVSRF